MSAGCGSAERRRAARVLVVGAGGLGSPVALVLAAAGVGTLGLVDDDGVELSNLHRQILYDEADVGASKVRAARRALQARAHRTGGPAPRVVLHETRLLPDNAVELVSAYDLVVEGSDNFPTKFLAADACALARVPVVHASAVRWYGTALAVGPGGGPCYRCIFEDVPPVVDGRPAPTCADAGVMGPVVGVVAALQADLALAILDRGPDPRPAPSAVAFAVEEAVAEDAPFGRLWTFDGAASPHPRARCLSMTARDGCPLCGVGASILRIDLSRYLPAAPPCAAS